MYTRVVECRVKLGKKGEFFDALQNQILPQAKKQPGFVDLMGWASDEHEDHVFAMTFWKTKEDADRFYRQESPMVAVLGPLSVHVATEHYYVPISTGHHLEVGKAATT
jgi:heme-degrading monooxygenase HmoA